jgi:phenylpyruvate tautomerase PptA (4-oxalocrotonate tautomerase family)
MPQLWQRTDHTKASELIDDVASVVTTRTHKDEDLISIYFQKFKYLRVVFLCGP